MMKNYISKVLQDTENLFFSMIFRVDLDFQPLDFDCVIFFQPNFYWTNFKLSFKVVVLVDV